MILTSSRDNISFFYLAAVGISMFILGITLVVLTLRQKVPKKLKKYLLLAGTTASAIFAGSILHNLFYALEVATKDIILISKLMGIISAGIFITSILIAPVGFIIGTLGAGALLMKRR